MEFGFAVAALAEDDYIVFWWVLGSRLCGGRWFHTLDHPSRAGVPAQWSTEVSWKTQWPESGWHCGNSVWECRKRGRGNLARLKWDVLV